MDSREIFKIFHVFIYNCYKKQFFLYRTHINRLFLRFGLSRNYLYFWPLLWYCLLYEGKPSKSSTDRISSICVDHFKIVICTMYYEIKQTSLIRSSFSLLVCICTLSCLIEWSPNFLNNKLYKRSVHQITNACMCTLKVYFSTYITLWK